MDLGKTLEGGTKMKSFWGTPFVGPKKWLRRAFVSVSQVYNLPEYINSASKVNVRANSPCLLVRCPKVYLSERKWFVFCSCKSRFLQINVDPGFSFLSFGVYVCFRECTRYWTQYISMLLFRCHVWPPEECQNLGPAELHRRNSVSRGTRSTCPKREFLYNLYGKSRCPNPVTTPLPNIIETGIGREDV